MPPELSQDERLESLASEISALREAVEALTAQVADLRQDVRGKRGLAGELRTVRELTESAVRRLSLDPAKLPWPERITARRFGSSSQRGEDGVLLALLDEGAEKTRRFVELGCGDNGGNSGFLARELGFKGLMVDGDSGDVQALKRELAPRGVKLRRAWITREGVDELLTDLGFTGEVDVLSIDIDGNDIWVWEALSAVQPRIVVIEYNSALGADRSVAVPYDPDFVRDRTRVMGRYYGASLAALANVGARKGYRLVACENVNAFFLRSDVARRVPEQPVRTAWRLYDRDGARLRKLGSVFEAFEREGLELTEVP